MPLKHFLRSFRADDQARRQASSLAAAGEQCAHVCIALGRKLGAACENLDSRSDMPLPAMSQIQVRTLFASNRVPQYCASLEQNSMRTLDSIAGELLHCQGTLNKLGLVGKLLEELWVCHTVLRSFCPYHNQDLLMAEPELRDALVEAFVVTIK